MHPRSLLRLSAALAGALILSCLPVLEGEDHDLRGQQVRLTFLHTSDIHSRLLPYDYSPIKTDVDLGMLPEAGPFGGATRIAAILKRERASADRVLHVDSGDIFQGAPIFNVNTGEVEYKFLSQVGANAVVIGNHEFDAGATNFVNRARDYADFPLLAANYIWDVPTDLASTNRAGLYTAPYTIQDVKGLKVAVIGMANVSTITSLTEGGNSIQATPYEQNEALRAYVDLLRPAVDLVTVVSHLGLSEDQDLINGYDAYFEYGKIKSFIWRDNAPWRILDWYGPQFQDASVVRVWIPGVSGVDVIFGGHLHVVLNPPQELQDPSGRKVLLVHSGAFAKFVGRLDAVVQVPKGDEPDSRLAEGGEILSHEYRVFPLDALWCDDALHAYYRDNYWLPGQFRRDPKVIEGIARCSEQEDRLTTQLLQPYIIGLDVGLQLTSIFAYTPADIERRNNSTGGDSPLGNIAADSMRKRRRVEAEIALTNTLGIRDNLYAGPLTQEAMFNVFPFENTINIMYLSGTEMQELFDFTTEKSADRGCQAQAQISGATFTMDCAQAQLNDIRYPCDPTKNGSDCPQIDREGRAPWQCLEDLTGNRCWAHSGINVSIQGQPLDPFGTYKIAVNDYIAQGGSGFTVLKRNTTRIETGISLRDSLIGYMQNYCSCKQLIAPPDANGRRYNAAGTPCGVLVHGQYVIEDQISSFCTATVAFQDAWQHEDGTPGPTQAQLAREVLPGCACSDVLKNDAAKCGLDVGALRGGCLPAAGMGPNLGKCSCVDALAGNTALCGNITQEVKAFCAAPGDMAIAIGIEDGRISRRLK